MNDTQKETNINGKEKSIFWNTLPGILTALATIIAATLGTEGLTGIVRNKISSPSPMKEFTVYADSMKGELYKNEEDKPVTISFTAKGKWLAIPEADRDDSILESAKGYISPIGDPNFKKNPDTPCPAYPLGALVFKKENECVATGKQGSFELKAGDTAFFLMNDVKKLYDDNKGHITVELSIE